MSEKRRSELVVRVRTRPGRNTKIEVFNGDDFPRSLFTDLRGDQLPATDDQRYRLRVNGVWSPRRTKVLYTPAELAAQLAELMRIPTQ